MVKYNEDTGVWSKRFLDGDWGAAGTELAIAQLAADSAPVISAYGAQIERIFVLPWHRAIILAKQDYLNHNDAWVKSLGADTVIDEKFGDKQLSQEIRNTWEISKFSLPDAVPMLDLYSLENKIRILLEN